jgi:hypothetical protein
MMIARKIQMLFADVELASFTSIKTITCSFLVSMVKPHEVMMQVSNNKEASCKPA